MCKAGFQGKTTMVKLTLLVTFLCLRVCQSSPSDGKLLELIKQRCRSGRTPSVRTISSLGVPPPPDGKPVALASEGFVCLNSGFEQFQEGCELVIEYFTPSNIHGKSWVEIVIEGQSGRIRRYKLPLTDGKWKEIRKPLVADQLTNIIYTSYIKDGTIAVSTITADCNEVTTKIPETTTSNVTETHPWCWVESDSTTVRVPCTGTSVKPPQSSTEKVTTPLTSGSTKRPEITTSNVTETLPCWEESNSTTKRVFCTGTPTQTEGTTSNTTKTTRPTSPTTGRTTSKNTKRTRPTKRPSTPSRRRTTSTTESTSSSLTTRSTAIPSTHTTKNETTETTACEEDDDCCEEK